MSDNIVVLVIAAMLGALVVLGFLTMAEMERGEEEWESERKWSG